VTRPTWPGEKTLPEGRVRHARRRTLRGLALTIAWPLLAHAGESGSLPAAEWNAIREVIGDQLAALRRGDGARAMGYATQALQRRFVDAEGFMRMVHGGYEALLVARYTEFLEGAVIDGVTIQPLRLVLPDNSVLVALYTMEREGARWHIGGCVLAPSTVKAA
jgi:hypothetical protein